MLNYPNSNIRKRLEEIATVINASLDLDFEHTFEKLAYELISVEKNGNNKSQRVLEKLCQNFTEHKHHVIFYKTEIKIV